MLQNGAYFLAKIGADTAENEQHFAENLPKNGNYPTGPRRSGEGRRNAGEGERRRARSRLCSDLRAVPDPGFGQDLHLHIEAVTGSDKL